MPGKYCPRVRAPRWFVAGLVVVALVGLGVRIAYTLRVADSLPTIGDAETYHLLANNLAEGKGYIRPHDPEPTATAEFPPLFPAVLSLASLAGLDSIQAHKLFTSLFGVATVVLVGLLGRRVGGPALGLTAALLAASYPMLFQVDGALMAESLYVPLVTATLLCTYWAIEGHTDGRSSLRRWALAGGLCGLAALTRTEALLLAPLVVVPEAVKHTAAAWSRRLVPGVVAMAAMVLVISPWLVRNYLTFDRFVPISNNSGTLIAGANCEPTFFGPMRGQWRLDCITSIDTAGLNEAETSAEYRRVGLEYANDNRDQVPTVVAARVLRTFGVHEVGGQINWETLEGRSHGWQTAGHRMYLVVAALALVGAVIGWRRRLTMWPLLAPLLIVATMAAVSYGNQRFRIAAEPGLVVLAAVSLVAGAGWLARVAGAAPSFTTLLAIPEGPDRPRRDPGGDGDNGPSRSKVPEAS